MRHPNQTTNNAKSNMGRMAIDCCLPCKPVFKDDGTQDLYYRHEACHTKCKRYNKQKARRDVFKSIIARPEHADYLRSRKKYKGKF